MILLMRKSYSHSSTYSFPSGFRAKLHDEALRAEFDGVGWDGVSNGRFIFIILCGHLEHVHIYLNIY